MAAVRAGLAAVTMIALYGVSGRAVNAQCNYSFVPAPRFGDGTGITFSPSRIGEDGIVGGHIATEPIRPGYWEPGVGITILPLPPGADDGRIHDVLNRDAMVGDVFATRPIFWRNGQWEQLPVPERISSGIAYGINRNLEIVGSTCCTTESGQTVFEIPVLWDDGLYIELPLPDGATLARPTHINDHGLIAGWARFSAEFSDTKIVVWRNLEPEILGDIDGGINIRPAGLNNDGTIVGADVDAATSQPRAFMALHGTLALLPTPPNALWALASKISDAGQITGGVSIVSIGERGVLWQDGRIIDLGTLTAGGTVIRSAGDMNADGIIVVTGGVLVPVGRPPGDIDNNCHVNVTDLLLLLREWGSEGSFADVSGDGIVNHWDLIDLLSNWG